MTESIISLLSIMFGVLSSNIYDKLKHYNNFDPVGYSISGVFGSILFIKSFGRFGFGPRAIMESGNVGINLLIINILVSILGGIVGGHVLNILRTRIKKR